MTLNGMQPTHTRRNGQMLRNALVLVIIFTLLFSGCSSDRWLGDGRGDWEIGLISGYCITRVNSYEILLTYNDASGTIVIPNYFIEAYQIQDPYIALRGFSRQGMSLSEIEYELKNNHSCFYLIDTTNKNVMGPFKAPDEFKDVYTSLKIEISDNWIETKDITVSAGQE